MSHASALTAHADNLLRNRAQPAAELHEVGDSVIWRTLRRRPCRPGAIHPDRRQTGAMRAGDVGVGIVPDVDDLRARTTTESQHFREHAPIRLQCADSARRDVPLEVAREPDAFEVRVAVREREQSVTPAQACEGGQHVGVKLHLVACRIEHFESGLRHRGGVARFGGMFP